MSLQDNLGIAMDAYCEQNNVNRSQYDVVLIDDKQVIDPIGGLPVPSDEQLQEALDKYESEQTKSDLKLSGFDFNGVMCSATGEDQNGLMAVAYKFNLLGENFSDTNFIFENGNTLVITKGNFVDFQTQWMQFRDQFFSAAG